MSLCYHKITIILWGCIRNNSLCIIQHWEQVLFIYFNRWSQFVFFKSIFFSILLSVEIEIASKLFTFLLFSYSFYRAVRFFYFRLVKSIKTFSCQVIAYFGDFFFFEWFDLKSSFWICQIFCLPAKHDQSLVCYEAYQFYAFY